MKKKNIVFLLIGALILVYVWRMLNAAKRVSFETVGLRYLGQGGFMNLSPTLGVVMQFTNPTTSSITVNSIYLDISAKDAAGNYFYIGSVKRAERFTIPANATVKYEFPFTLDTIATAKYLVTYAKDGELTTPTLKIKGFVQAGIFKARINTTY